MKRIIAMLFIVLVSVTVIAQKAIPTDDQVKAISEQLNAIRKSGKAAGEKKEELKNFIIATDNKYDISKFNLSQIKTLIAGGALYAEDAVKDWLLPQLARLSEKPDVDGAEAAGIVVTSYYKSEMADWIIAYEKLVTHPAIKDFLLTNRSGDVFGRLQFLDKPSVGKSSLIQKMIPLLDYELSDRAAETTVNFFDVVADEATGMDGNLIELVRSKAQAHYGRLIDKAATGSKGDFVRRVYKYLDGPYARRTLLNNTAPEIGFTWYSNGDVKKLSDLKGKVVVVDFWAVWCSPCIGSFPNILKLQERYKDYPVEIIGVTSIQGYHIDLKNNKRIALKDNPAEEMRLMHEFMQMKNMTWKVAYGDNCFNPDYGVRGIPHVAIIDPTGKVRYNRLRPYEAPFHEAEKIDALLKEAGLPFPEQPMEKTNFSGIEE